MADLGSTIIIESSPLTPANGQEGAPSNNSSVNPDLSPPMNYPNDFDGDRGTCLFFPSSVKDTLVVASRTIYYLMRGYYATGSVYESWVAINIPNSTPPSGHSLTNITVVTSWIT